jgi:peptidoglycan/xylan/chitin deacetylase (PgdA/CDA1 family)
MRTSMRIFTAGPLRAALRRAARSRPAILGYHGIGDCSRADDPSLLQISPVLFEAQLRLLLEAGFRFITVAALAAKLTAGEPAEGFAAVSFDDGMRNNLTAAAPILARLAIPATVYIAVGFIAGHSPWICGPEGAMLNRQEILRLHAEGWEIGAHTITHPDMSNLSYQECLAEITESRRMLEELTGAAVKTFAYPFGNYGPAALAASRDSGLLASVTTGSGKWEPHELTRTMVNSGDPMAVVVLKLLDCYEPMLANRPMRLARDFRRQLGVLASSRQSRP